MLVLLIVSNVFLTQGRLVGANIPWLVLPLSVAIAIHPRTSEPIHEITLY